MFTRHYHITAVSPFKTHWSFRPGLPCQTVDHVVSGLTIAYELTFQPTMTEAQRADAIRYFRESAFRNDQQEMRAAFVSLFARRAHLATWELGAAA